MLIEVDGHPSESRSAKQQLAEFDMNLGSCRWIKPQGAAAAHAAVGSAASCAASHAGRYQIDHPIESQKKSNQPMLHANTICSLSLINYSSNVFILIHACMHVVFIHPWRIRSTVLDMAAQPAAPRLFCSSSCIHAWQCDRDSMASTRWRTLRRFDFLVAARTSL